MACRTAKTGSRTSWIVLVALLALSCGGKDGPTAPPTPVPGSPTPTLTAAPPTATPLPPPNIVGAWSASITSSDPGCGPLSVEITFMQQGTSFQGFFSQRPGVNTAIDSMFAGTIAGTSLGGSFTERTFSYPSISCVRGGDFTGVLRSPTEMMLSIPMLQRQSGDGVCNPCQHYTVIATR